jgi:putative tricarboxylic transport membrane protein
MQSGIVMEPSEQDTSRRVSNRAVEIGTAAVVLALGAVVLVDSLRLGARWADDGPQAGYFPFYLSVIMCLAGGWILLRAMFDHGLQGAFVSVAQLRLVLKLFLPLLVYVVLIGFTGIYVASVLFITYCMRRIGSYGWARSVIVPVLVMATVFLMFELWFKVPLPKGPLEALLGLN